jgi:hypothetical protein
MVVSNNNSNKGLKTKIRISITSIGDKLIDRNRIDQLSIV